MHRLFTHFFPVSQFFKGFPVQHSPSAQTPLRQIKCALQGITNHCTPFRFLLVRKFSYALRKDQTLFPSLVFTTDLRAFLQHRPNILTNLEDLPNKLFGTFIAHFVTPLFLHFAISQFFCKTLNSSDILTYNMPLIHTFFTCSRWNMAYSFFYQTYIHHKEIKFLQEGYFCY